MSKSIPQHLINENVYVVNYLVYLDEEKKQRFIYIAVRGDKMDDFQKIVLKGNFIAEDYGIVLEEGEGEPDDLLKAKMEYQYKCDHAKLLPLIG